MRKKYFHHYHLSSDEENYLGYYTYINTFSWRWPQNSSKTIQGRCHTPMVVTDLWKWQRPDLRRISYTSYMKEKAHTTTCSLAFRCAQILKPSIIQASCCCWAIPAVPRGSKQESTVHGGYVKQHQSWVRDVWHPNTGHPQDEVAAMSGQIMEEEWKQWLANDPQYQG